MTEVGITTADAKLLRGFRVAEGQARSGQTQLWTIENHVVIVR